MLIRTISAAVLLLGLWGCAQLPHLAFPPTLSVAEREALARDLLARKEYADALVQWKILAVINPSSAEYAEQTRLIQAIIARETDRHRKAGLASWRAGTYEEARLSFLKTLALDPRDQTALSYLRELDMLHMQSRQNNKGGNAAPKENGQPEPPRRKKTQPRNSGSRPPAAAPNQTY